MKSHKGKSKPFPSELAQTERRNIKKRMAATAKTISDLQRKVSKATNYISSGRNSFETKLNSTISARVALAFVVNFAKKNFGSPKISP